MALEVKWSKRADKKFDKILEFLLLEWAENVTISFVRNVYDFINILSEYPEIGTLEHREKKIRGFTLVKQVNVFYRITEKEIIILDFFDNRKDPKKKRF